MKKINIINKIIRRRKKRKREMEERGFDTSSIGDLAFLLLIFFIVTASFIVRQGIFFSLPGKGSGSIKVEENQFTEVFPKNEGFYFKGKMMDRETFKKSLNKKQSDVKNCVLIIRMSPKVKYERLVDTLSIAREIGLKRISIKNVTGDSI